MEGLEECSPYPVVGPVTGSDRLRFSGEAFSCMNRRSPERKSGLGNVQFPHLPFGTSYMHRAGYGGKWGMDLPQVIRGLQNNV